MQARLGLQREADRLGVSIEQLSFRALEPVVVVEQVSGGINLHEGDLTLDQLAIRTAESRVTLEGSVQELMRARSE